MSSFVDPIPDDEEAVAPQPLSSLCNISQRACIALSDFVSAVYSDIGTGQLSTLKADSSAFTIADGLVQFMLTELFTGKVKAIVGEEDETQVHISSKPYRVGDLEIPEMYYILIEQTFMLLACLKEEISDTSFQELTVFIDPIDGTKEFTTKLGEQCTICIGFSDSTSGKSVAGVVYRPITGTWAAGAPSESYAEAELDNSPEPQQGLLTSNGGISPFISGLIAELGVPRVPSGGAGNKALMLIEQKASCYIQDRGVSRWDTCAVESILSAHGATFSRLTAFEESATAAEAVALGGYTYRKTETNLDYNPKAALTKFNSKSGNVTPSSGDSPSEVDFKVYSNLCGLAAIGRGETAERYHSAIKRALQAHSAAYD